MAAVASQYAVPAHNLSKLTLAEEASAPKSETAAEPYTIPRGDVTATLNFFVPPEDGVVPYNYVKTPPEGKPALNYTTISVSVPIYDIRGHEDEYNLDKDAFEVIHNVPESAEKDFTEDESIQKNYYPEVEKVILENVPGSNRVIIFDHTIRGPNTKLESPNWPSYGLRTHIDQTARAARDRVKRHLGSEAEALLQGRYRIINLWRPINGPVADHPLSFASSASVENSDLIPIEHRYPDWTGSTAGVKYNEGQKWHYLSGIRNDERLLLECFDSEGLKEGSKVRGGRVPHSAFVDPRTPVGAPPRKSIEVRTLVFGP